MLDGFEHNEKMSSEDAENAILGEIILDNSVMRRTARLSVPSFSSPFRRAVYAAMLELDEDGDRIDPVTVATVLKRDHGDMYQISSITNLTYGLPPVADIRKYVRIAAEAAARRKAFQKATALAEKLRDGRITLKQFCTDIAALESELREEYAEETDSFKPLSQVLQTEVLPALGAYFKTEKSEFLISTGFPEIDDVLGGGLYLSDMIAIVAPPKSAKSAFALQLALNFAQTVPVGLLSLEMSNLQNGLRFIAQKSFIDSVEATGTADEAISASWLRPGIYESTFREASKVAASLFDAQLYLCQKPLTWKEVQAEVRRLVKEKGLKVLIVDYWQLVHNEKRGYSRADSLAEIAKGLKQLGQELNIAIVALGQFNQEGLRLHKSGGELSPLYLEGSGELVKSANIVLTIDIKEADLDDKHSPRKGTLTFRPLRSGSDARLNCLFIGKYLTLVIAD